jgi:hypothetical protein
MKCTPGEWVAVAIGSEGVNIKVKDPQDRKQALMIVAQVRDPEWPELMANAHMMAAAKDLYEALKLAYEDLTIWHERHMQAPDGGIVSVPCDGCTTCEETLPAIKAALAKAVPEVTP